MKKVIILSAVGVLLLIAGIAGVCDGSRTLGDLDIVYGELVTVEGAADTELGVHTNTPVLLRHVEMLQYYINPQGKLDKKYDDTRLPSVKAEIFGTTRTFDNPPFPDLGAYTYFTGVATVGKDGPQVSAELLEKLCYGNYVDFQNGSYRHQLTNLPDDVGMDLIRFGDYYGAPGDDTEVGHIRVSYYIGVPEGSYTVAGTLQDGVIGKAGKHRYIYDYSRTYDEIAEGFNSTEGGMRSAAYLFIAVGALLCGLGVRALVRLKKA